MDENSKLFLKLKHQVEILPGSLDLSNLIFTVHVVGVVLVGPGLVDHQNDDAFVGVFRRNLGLFSANVWNDIKIIILELVNGFQ